MTRTKSLLPIDELNNLQTKLSETAKLNKDEVVDEIFDLLILAYMKGNEAANFDLSSDYEIVTDALQDAIYRKTAGKDFAERVREHIDNNDPVSDIMRVADTEMHRVYNTALFDVAETSGAYKTWVTMLDDRVREAHQFLEGVTVAWNERFYTENDSALYPGGFESADLNVGCRCDLILSK